MRNDESVREELTTAMGPQGTPLRIPGERPGRVGMRYEVNHRGGSEDGDRGLGMAETLVDPMAGRL